MDKFRQHSGLLLILAVALFIRFYRLADAPPGMSGDELFNAIDAWRVGVGHWPLFFEGNNGREALFLYLTAASLRLGGQTLFALRLPAALLGTGSVLLAYLIGQEQFNRRVGLLAAGLMAVSLWPVMLSRWGLRAGSLTFFTALTVYLIMRALHKQTLQNWLGAGAALGLTLYTYIPARLFPVVILAWFGWIVWKHQQARTQGRYMALCLLTALLLFAPFGWYTWQHPDKVNQRLYTMTSALDLARDEGELKPLAQSTLSTLGMFSFAGDGEWRYHLSGRPVFDPVTSLFFYAGLLFCIWYIFRRDNQGEAGAGYALLLLWLGAMLIPNAVLDSNPSFLRAAGAIVPVYLITAVGLDRAAAFIERRRPAWQQRPYLPILATLGLSLILANTWHNYFVIWNQHEEVRSIYHAGLAQIGQFLREQPPSPETRIFVVDTYAYDTAPQALPYYAYKSSFPGVSWVQANTGLALPASDTTAETWYLVPFNESLPEPIAARFNLESLSTRHLFEDGETAFTLYQIPTHDLVETPIQPLNTAFADGPTLRGYELAADPVRGESTIVFTHWQIPADQPPLPNRLLSMQIRLEDARGNLWQRHSELLGYPQASWRAGDRFLQVLPLELPAGMPPGAAYLHFDLLDNQGRPLNLVGSNRSEPLFVSGQLLEDFSPTPDMLVLDETLVLRQAAFSSLLVPGLPINIALDWVALRPPPADYRVYLELIQPGESEPFYHQVDDLWPDIYPPTEWQAGEQVSTLHRLHVPLQIPTETNPELRLRLLPPDNDTPLPATQGEATLAVMTLSLRQHQFDVPAMQMKTEAQFGDSIRLLGYDLATDQIGAGDTVRLTLYWQADTTPAANFTVFNHLVGADGQIGGQLDSPPTGDAWLTKTWLPGEVIIDEREIPVRPSTANGRFALAIGLYTAGDGTRLPVQVNGVLQPNDQLVLTEIEIR
jgi:4-amino-4-deoxy-L-arabinose transferase-like glycosyltransferase